MVPSPTKEHVGNVVEAESRKVEVESSVDTKKENTERINVYMYIVIHRELLYWG